MPAFPVSATANPARSPWGYLLRYRLHVASGVAMLALTNGLALTIPYLMGSTVEALNGENPARDVPRLAALIVLFAVLQAAVRIASRVGLFNAARRAEHDLRSDLFGHLLTLEPGYYRSHPTGDIMSRLTNDVQTVRVLWGPGVLNSVNTTIAFASAIALMLAIDPWLTLWAMTPYPAILLAGQLFGRRIHGASRDVQEQLGALSTLIQEDLTGINVIKTYTLEEPRRRHFAAFSRVLLWRNMALTKIRGLLLPALVGLASLATVIIIYAGGRSVIAGRMTLGQLVQFNGYLALLMWPTMALGWMISLFQRGLASWSRLQELLQSRPAIADGPTEELPPQSPGDGAGSGRIEVRDLTLAFDGRTVLEGVTFIVPAGSVTAIVGRTGAGKSSLLEAIPRLLEVPKKTIFLDGVDITELSLPALRRAIGYAPQEAFLFSTTIERNISYGVEPAKRGDQLEQRRTTAATAAGLARDLPALPEGYATIVGERGITLSGGQRQRVALARALATRPRVLILDDSLSSVDAETEREILSRLDEVRGGRTALLVSHRIAAVKRADQILVMDEGRIVERGTHEELLASGGLYAELYQVQLEDELEDVDSHAAGEAAAAELP